MAGQAERSEVFESKEILETDLIEDEDEDDPRCPGFVKQKPVYRFFRI
jgi:hypothetical protein